MLLFQPSVPDKNKQKWSAGLGTLTSDKQTREFKQDSHVLLVVYLSSPAQSARERLDND